MFHKEGAKIILIGMAVTVAVVLLAEQFILSFWLLKFIQIFALVFLILILLKKCMFLGVLFMLE